MCQSQKNMILDKEMIHYLGENPFGNGEIQFLITGLINVEMIQVKELMLLKVATVKNV